MGRRLKWPLLVLLFSVSICLRGKLVQGDDGQYKAGGAGHSLLFRDHGIVLWKPKDFPVDAITFEAWVSTSDVCHLGTLLSYALDSQATDEAQWVADFNHFVVFDPANLVACHDFQYIDLHPDPGRISCYAAFNHSQTADYVERDGAWHHIAVTWTAANNGLTKIYMDGMLMAETPTGKTNPLQPGGALMLGGEQDCYGGCTDKGQGYYGLMDEVRIWKVERTQDEIVSSMRVAQGLENHANLVAYWKFNDPDVDDANKWHYVAKDSSGHGNDITLIVPPDAKDEVIEKDDKRLETGFLAFQNNYAMNDEMDKMPTKDFTVEFWARTPTTNEDGPPPDDWAELFSYATHLDTSGSRAEKTFVDDAILIEKYNKEYRDTSAISYMDLSTMGSISVHVNANREGNGAKNDHWMDFAVGWTDDAWHHIAVSWVYETAETQLYWDGEAQVPFWVSRGGRVEHKSPESGGVDRHMAAQTLRADKGSLVLGQNQECFGGCFSPQYALEGDIASLRVWDRVRSQEEVQGDMWEVDPSTTNGLRLAYRFGKEQVKRNSYGQPYVAEHASDADSTRLYLWSDTPRFVHSTAPLADEAGLPVAPPTAGAAGHALYLSDQQVLMLPDFKDFPAEEITVEFWMWSADACRQGTPFSYATGPYEHGDNTFLIFNYNNWGISVMEDEGYLEDHLSGISSTDGKWHHIAATWSSADGRALLYDNGRLVWSVTRAKGQKLPSGGTLILGREQDCMGGCFDSQRGAAGKLDPITDQEYGPQDFFGLIDEVRIWKVVRTPQEILEGMQADLGRLEGKPVPAAPFHGGGVDPDDWRLVAYWNFDEGAGYTVRDITRHGHDLRIQKTPRWEVVQWFATCGNGVVEGGEECDDGNTIDGDGCSSTCQIEGGYECAGRMPSRCWPSGERPPDMAPGGTVTPDGGVVPPVRPGDTPAHKQSSGGLGPWAVVGIVSAVLTTVLAGTLVVWKREAIAEQLPGLARGWEDFKERLPGRRRHPIDYGGLVLLDPEETMELAPDFASAVPGPRCGPYSHLRGSQAPGGV